MNVGSLFSGVGGLDLGLARAGFTHRWFCESDPWRRSVLAAHWPGVPIYDDVRSVAMPRDELRADGITAAGERPHHGRGSVDLLCGGFPCQDLSVAGQRKGLAGNRSGLFFEFARIIDVVRPGWVLVENVPGLLSSNGGRDFGIVLGTLADLGYGVAWRVVDSRFFGVPQRRRRVFILGARANGDSRAAAERAGEILAVGTRCPRHSQKGGEAGADVAAALGGSVVPHDTGPDQRRRVPRRRRLVRRRRPTTHPDRMRTPPSMARQLDKPARRRPRLTPVRRLRRRRNSDRDGMDRPPPNDSPGRRRGKPPKGADTIRALTMTLAALTLTGTATAHGNHPERDLRKIAGPCLSQIIERETAGTWDHHIYNYQGSGAYGLPQALPGHKMRSAGADWRTNPLTQIRWLRSYARSRYGSECGALAFHNRNGWY